MKHQKIKNSGGTPNARLAAAAFVDFCRTISKLRDPKRGCPWDLEQDFISLRKYMIEEAYEASAAMRGGDRAKICEELGDVLLQVVLNAQIGLGEKRFDIVDVIKTIDSKMKRRHPHVFATNQVKINAYKSARAVHQQWQEIKAKEKSSGSKITGGVFSEIEKSSGPPSQIAVKIGKAAAKINFDWDNVEQVLGQLNSEIRELKREIRRKRKIPARIADELGDVYFTLAQLCRHLNADPEVITQDGVAKFLRRFSQLEKTARIQGIDPRTASKKTLEALWKSVKS